MEVVAGKYVQRVTDAIYEMMSRLGDDFEVQDFIHEIVKAALNARDIEEFRTWHIDRTIETARDRDGCHQFDEYLTAIWGQGPEAIPSHRNQGEKVWHDSSGRSRFHSEYNRCREHSAKHCLCGHECSPSCRLVEESYSWRGHVLMHQDGQQSCLTCGAVYDVLVDIDGTPDLVGGDGEPIMRRCTERTYLVHGPADLRVCQERNGMECEEFEEIGACEHVSHDCDGVCCYG